MWDEELTVRRWSRFNSRAVNSLLFKARSANAVSRESKDQKRRIQSIACTLTSPDFRQTFEWNGSLPESHYYLFPAVRHLSDPIGKANRYISSEYVRNRITTPPPLLSLPPFSSCRGSGLAHDLATISPPAFPFPFPFRLPLVTPNPNPIGPSPVVMYPLPCPPGSWLPEAGFAMIFRACLLRDTCRSIPPILVSRRGGSLFVGLWCVCFIAGVLKVEMAPRSSSPSYSSSGTPVP